MYIFYYTKFVFQFQKYILRTYYAPGTILVTEDKVMYKIDVVTTLMELIV